MIDDVQSSIKKLMEDNKKLKTEIKTLNDTIKDLQKDVIDLQMKIKDDTVQNKQKNLVIFGTNGGENSEKDVAKILKKLEVSFSIGDFTVIKTTKINPWSPIIVTFTKNEVRNKVIENRK